MADPAARPARRLRRLGGQLCPHRVASEGSDFTFVSETPNVRVERRGRVALLTLVRTSSLNALCDELITDLSAALTAAQKDPSLGCLVLTGAGRAFAAGADIKEMYPLSFADITASDKFKAWQCVADCQLPVIAAVNGFAFGGGCEIAMMCDIIIASEKAVFGQPEIKLGVIPGAGGTQRLVRAVGKSKAMALILTGRNMTAEQAERAGLVAQVVKHEQLLPVALEMAEEIAGMGRLATSMAKQAVNGADETTLQTGIQLEKRLFNSLFSTDDKKEGMEAFINKRKPNFTHK